MADTTKIFVKSNQEQGRWRAGRHIPMAGLELDADEATLKALQADQSLTIRPVSGGQAAPGAGQKAEPGALNTAVETGDALNTRPLKPSGAPKKD